MKTRLKELREEIEKQINDGKFTIIQTSKSDSFGYIGMIKISVSGLAFEFSIADEGRYLCQHGGDISLTDNISKKLEEAYNNKNK